MKYFSSFWQLLLGAVIIDVVLGNEFLSLFEPHSTSFGIYPDSHVGDLATALSELQPVFMYASSQKDFIHKVPPSPKQHPRAKSALKSDNSRAIKQHSDASQNQKIVKVRNNSPPLTYGFIPKTPRPRIVHSESKQNPSYQESTSPRKGKRLQDPLSLPSIRFENKHSQGFEQNKQFRQSIHVHSTLNHHPQNADNIMFSHAENGLSHFSHGSQHENRPTHFVETDRHLHHQQQGIRHDLGSSINHDNRGSHQEEGNIQKKPSQHITYTNENAAHRYPERNHNRNTNYHSHANVNVQQTYSNQRPATTHVKEHGRLNLYNNARSLRGDNRPQLPPRIPYNSGGIRINALAEQLPVLHLNSFSNTAPTQTIYLQNGGHIPLGIPTADQGKKTYLLLKPPTLVTTERPPSAPFSPSDGATKFRTPEITYSVPTEAPTFPQTANTNTPIVFDLVEIPDSEAYEQNHKDAIEIIDPPDHTIHEPVSEPDHDDISGESLTRNVNLYTETAYATTPSYPYDNRHELEDKYMAITEMRKSSKPSNDLHQEFKKSLNASALLPISYSSSISVITAKENNYNKQHATKKPKMTLKKSLPSKKKAALPENYDYIADDPYGSQNVPGRPGSDYPTYNEIPFTNFDCRDIKSPGFYADLEAGCQVFHNCDMGKKKHSFMCPNGTIFHQELFICDWWYNVKCDDSPEFYNLNAGLFIEDSNREERGKKFR